MKELLKSFHLNGHMLGFYLRNYNLKKKLSGYTT